MSLEMTLMSSFIVTLIAWVFDFLTYWHYMCLEVNLMTSFIITFDFILWLFDFLIYRLFMSLDASTFFEVTQLKYHWKLWLWRNFSELFSGSWEGKSQIFRVIWGQKFLFSAGFKTPPYGRVNKPKFTMGFWVSL